MLRPPTLGALRSTLTEAIENGKPFQVVHFDGHGVMARHSSRAGALRPLMFSPRREASIPVSVIPTGSGSPIPARIIDQPSAGAEGEGFLEFEAPGGGSESVSAAKVAAVLRDASVPVVVLNACQSGAVGKDLEAAVATRLLQEGAASVVGMAYSLYAVAAAEFMAMFYERLFAGDTVSAAVTAGRRRLFQHDLRPSPKGAMRLEDWLVPVHYVRREIRFPLAGSKADAGQQSSMQHSMS